MVTDSDLSSLESLLPYASADELRRVRRILAHSSPGGLAAVATSGRQTSPPHLKLLDEHLLAVADRRITRLVISMAPRHGKSERTSRFFPAWYLGTHPEHRVILASYEAGFAANWGRKARDVLEQLGGELFGIKIRGDSSAAHAWDLAGHDGGMVTAGVGGPITGKGAHVLIVDDPIKNAEEAQSELIRARHKDWWQSTAYTRLEPDGAAIVMCTRWHEDDLPGWLIKEGKTNGEPWTVLNLPAIAEASDSGPDPIGRLPGEALWPDRFPASRLQAIQRVVGSYWFGAMYQGSPQPAEGNKYKRPWFRYCKRDAADDLVTLLNRDGTHYRTVKLKDCRFFATADLAFSLRKTADYTVIAIWAVTPDSDLVLIELIRERMTEPDFLRLARMLFHKHRLDYVAVESNGAQLGVVQCLRAGGYGDDGAYHFGVPVRAVPAHTDKVTRAGTALVRTEAGQVYFPLGAPWLGEYERELLSFPNGSHDDMVDATSIAAIEVFYAGGSGKTDEAQAAFDAAVKAQAERKARTDFESVDNDHWWS